MAAPIAGVTYCRAPGDPDWSAPFRPDLPGLPVTTTSSFDAFPNEDTHPGAVWTRSGNKLTSPGRNPQWVFDYTDGFKLGQTEPTWENSGCRLPISQLTKFVGTSGNKHELVTTADGQVIEKMYLPDSRIRVAHKNVIIRDCYISTGYDSTRKYVQNNAGIVCDQASFDTRGLLVEYTTIDPVNAGANGTADDADVAAMFISAGSAVHRCAWRKVTDGIMSDIYPLSGVEPFTALGNYSETRWLAYDPKQSDGTHNDGIQIAGGSGHAIWGNALRNPTGGVTGPGSSSIVQGQCIVFTPYHSTADTGFATTTRDSASTSLAYIGENWLYGSYSQISAWNSYYEGGPGVPNLFIEGNRHGGQCVWPMLLTPFTNNSKRLISGNVAAVGGLKWNQAGGSAGTSTIAAGGTVNPTVANPQTKVASESHPSTAFAGSDQIAEPGTTFYLIGKGKDASNNWVKTGTWSVVSNTGAAITLVSGTGTDGATWTGFDVPKPTSTQTIVMRFTPTGVAATDDMTITIPPWQTGA